MDILNSLTSVSQRSKSKQMKELQLF